MRRIVCALAATCLVIAPAAACTFCGGGLATRQTLREHFRRANYVAHGKLANPRFDPNGGTGSTELHVAKVLKPDPAIGDRAVVVLPRYLPVIGDTSPEYLVFCATAGGKPDPLHGVPATDAVTEYLLGATKLDDKDAVARLGYFFKHLDSADPTVAADAFLEFAKASDADIVKARSVLDLAKVRKLFVDPAHTVGTARRLRAVARAVRREDRRGYAGGSGEQTTGARAGPGKHRGAAGRADFA